MIKVKGKETKKMKRFNFKVPHAYVLLCGLIVLIFLLTFIVPSGQYERVKDEVSGRIVAKAGSYHVIEKEYLTLMDLPIALAEGMQRSSAIIFFVMLACGAFQVIKATGVFDGLTSLIARRFGDKEKLIIPIFLIFAEIRK